VNFAFTEFSEVHSEEDRKCFFGIHQEFITSCLYDATSTLPRGARKREVVHMKRIVGLVAVATIVAALIAGPVAAQGETEHVPFSSEINTFVVNPCNGESVLITGVATGFTQEVQTPSGRTFTKFHVVENGTGVGSEGNQYVYHQTFNGGQVGTLPLTATVPLLVISQGSTDNFVVHQVVHFNVDGQLEFIKFGDPQCRG
jgi:hypothetical protein